MNMNLEPNLYYLAKEPPPPMLFCSFKKCGSAFESQQELEDHMQTYHQPPFSPAKQPSVTTNTSLNKPAKKSVKFKVRFFHFTLLFYKVE